ncbi:hypothetical protein ACLOJK_034234, partial [Asimina triloba]
MQFNTLHVYSYRCTIGAPSSGAPSSPTAHRLTHLWCGSDQLIGAVQKIGHEEMIYSPKSHLRAASTATDLASHDATMIGFFLTKRNPARSSMTMAARWRGWGAAARADCVGTGQQASITHLANKRQATAVGFETQQLQWTTGASRPLFG